MVLVSQQAEVVEMHAGLKVGKYLGEMGADFKMLSIRRSKKINLRCLWIAIVKVTNGTR